jgi:hypothetical protein
MNGPVVIGEVHWTESYATTAAYATVSTLEKGKWYTFSAEATGAYIRPHKSSGTWEYTREGVYIERGSSRSYFLADGEFSYYIPTGGTLRVEQVNPIDPYPQQPGRRP